MFAFTRKDVDARVVGNALVVSFTGIELQKTWRADMAGLQTATLELKDEGKKFSVVMKKDSADETIASFTDKESAVYALSAITDAMLKGDTHVLATQGGQTMAVLTKIFKGVVVLLLLLLLFQFLAPAILGPSGGLGKPGVSRTGFDKGGIPSNMKPGEPIPADQLFK